MTRPASSDKPARFISLRWRVLPLVFAVVLVIAMLGAFMIGSDPAAVYPTNAARQVTALLVSLGAALVVITAFVITTGIIERLNRVLTVARALADGELTARTGLRPNDEIGALGYALDLYADHVQERQDALRLSLRRQRREVAYLTSVMEALPHGVLVQDLEGHVIFINDRARSLLGSQTLSDGHDLGALTDGAGKVLGPALAPGLYALGDPQRVELGGRMVSAQAAAVMSAANERVGTVIALRDITEDVRLERARDVLLKRLEDEVQKPLSASAQSLAAARVEELRVFARDISRHASALQNLIADTRDLTADKDIQGASQSQKPLLLDTLIWSVANEWRQVAQAANVSLQVEIERPGLYVLGDERRLRWAIGSIVDNAIKFIEPGGIVRLESKGEERGLARLRVRDNGVGISQDDLPHAFTRFFRGKPISRAGQPIYVPGTGQGLTLTKQIIEAHGGRIQIRSTQGVGTAVYFTLPVTAPVSLDLPGADADMDGETMQLRTSELLPEGER